ncbi:heme biosynthesis protein HemY [Fretibacter rubidus]|uniref:heme biosynthesis protein HemY n=1 Tax=Fretibacter rubidus TaxID=570162 RepID=UPI003529DED6
MMKYVIAIVFIMAAIAGFLLYIGDSSQLVLTSTSPRGFLNFDITLSWKIFTVIATLALIGIILLWSFVTFLFRLPGRLKSGMGLRRRNQALDAMEDALLAGAEGDADKSRKKAERARALVGSNALGRIVSAQAAEACGDNLEAMTQYEAMLDDPKTEATGRRGLAQQRLATGDIAGAIELAKTAYDNDKSAHWAFDVLFKAQLEDHQWAAASETLARGERRKHIDKETARRRRAVLMTAEADRLTDAGLDLETALELAQSAASTAPDFAPGVALAARLLTKSDRAKKAINLIEKAWAVRPHPALSLAMNDTMAGESEKTRTKRIAALAKTNPGHSESILMIAEDALRRGDGVAAWSALSPLVVSEAPTTRVCQLAYQAETMLDNDADARLWLERAAVAPSEPDWSDLDPQGTAFDYTDQDWRRLVFSFGETGELIHPRFEAGAARRSVGVNVPTPKVEIVAEKPADDIPAAKTATRQPDDPGVLNVDADDLAERLDSLLGDGPKKG